MTELEHTVQLLYKEALPAKISMRDGSPIVCYFWSLTKINGSKHEQNIQFGLKEIENMHGHWFISFGQEEHAFLGSGLHFIQNNLVFASIRPSGFNLQDATFRSGDIVVSPDILRLFQWFPD